MRGFTKQGDILVDHDWVIDRAFGHITHGYVTTSHASQGATVDKVFVAISGRSLAATDRRTAYVSVTRGKEQVVVFTDDKDELLKAIRRPDDPLSATALRDSSRTTAGADATDISRPLNRGFGTTRGSKAKPIGGEASASREADHAW